MSRVELGRWLLSKGTEFKTMTALVRDILMSEGFDGHIDAPLESCAAHRVKGVGHPVEIFGCG